MIDPALNISPLLIIPEENAIAFGGVDTGNAIPIEQANATDTASIIVLSPGMDITIGISKLAVAVLLTNVDKSIPSAANTAMRINP